MCEMHVWKLIAEQSKCIISCHTYPQIHMKLLICTSWKQMEINAYNCECYLDTIHWEQTEQMGYCYGFDAEA